MTWKQLWQELKNAWNARGVIDDDDMPDTFYVVADTAAKVYWVNTDPNKPSLPYGYDDFLKFVEEFINHHSGGSNG